jgi:hypothetical protein
MQKEIASLNKLSFLVAFIGLAVSSQATHAQQLPDTTAFASLGAGTKIIVGQDAFILPANDQLVYFQNGVPRNYNAIDQTQPSCRLELHVKAVVRQLLPGRAMIVTATEFSNDRQGYTNALDFGSDGAVDKLQCSRGYKGEMTIGELKIALGGLFRLQEATPDSA